MLPDEFDKVMQQSKEIFEGIQERPALAATGKVKRRRKRNGGSKALASIPAGPHQEQESSPKGASFLAATGNGGQRGGAEFFSRGPLGLRDAY